MDQRTRDALVERLRRYERLVEIGIGRRADVAAALAAHATVIATDVTDRPVPDGVRFVRDDIAEPTGTVYAGADAIYALNLPPDLHAPALAVARTHDTALAFTTLGGDAPAIPCRPETIPGDTLYWARGSDGGSSPTGPSDGSTTGP